jgi:hypothetical protein
MEWNSFTENIRTVARDDDTSYYRIGIDELTVCDAHLTADESEYFNY